MAKFFGKHDTEGFEGGQWSGFQEFYSKLLLARKAKWGKAPFTFADEFSKWTRKVNSTGWLRLAIDIVIANER